MMWRKYVSIYSVEFFYAHVQYMHAHVLVFASRITFVRSVNGTLLFCDWLTN